MLVRIATILSTLLLGILVFCATQVSARPATHKLATSPTAHPQPTLPDHTQSMLMAEDLTIIGPIVGAIDTSYIFTATVVTEHLPITYTWQTSDSLLPVVRIRQSLTDTMTLEWDTPGTRTITVTATMSNTTTVTATHTIAIQMPVTTMQIAGSPVVEVNTPATYTATTGPAQATPPVRYTWQASGLPEVVHPNRPLTDTIALEWDTPGTRIITVTATNMDQQTNIIYHKGTVVQTYTVSVQAPPQALALDGPTMGIIGKSYTFTATTTPPETSLPLVYTWQATNQEPYTTTDGGLTDQTTLTWDTPGTKHITVTVKNGIDSITQHQEVIIVANIAITIVGPHEGDVGETETFTATVSPSNLPTPLTYTWDVGKQAAIVHSDAGLTDSIRTNWQTIGTQVITVSVTHALGSAVENFTIAIKQAMSQVYMPIVHKTRPKTIYGFETSPGRIANDALLQRAKELDSYWVRIKTVHWREVQPTEGGAYDWSALETFEKELAAVNEAAMTPIVIVHQNPDWATIPNSDAVCAAVDESHFDDYARFFAALVARYSQPPYNVHYWELGNEPDVDPDLMTEMLHSHFGCWGDTEAPYYGGTHYGKMLQAIAPAIKQQDPQATIIIGGLLLDKPVTEDPGLGKPELFLKGILEQDRGNSFDAIAFHAYPWYTSSDVDDDMDHKFWGEYGGATLGKIAYIKNMLQEYGVSKPLYLTEGSMLYWSDPNNPVLPDDEIPADFQQTQAAHLVRQVTRALDAGVEAYSWYTLHRSGWNYTGLLNGNNSPRPAYTAYAFYIDMIGDSRPVQTSDYGDMVYAYRFDQGTRIVDVVWKKTGGEQIVDVPSDVLQAVYQLDGTTQETVDTGATQKVKTSLMPVYIVRSH